MSAIRPWLLLSAVLLLPFWNGVADAAPPSLFIEELTWTELRDRVVNGATTILIPIGGTEQSGPAIALGKHNVRVKVLAQKIAEGLGNALIAPVVAYVPEGNIDPPTGHMKFPGTITVSDQVFEALLESAARGFAHQGFKTIVLIGDHGGYQADETVVADRLNREWKAGSTRVFADLDYYRISQSAYAAKLEAAGVAPAEIGTHAGLADTSLMLATDTQMVRTDLLSKGSGWSAADGVFGGDPTRASAAYGQIGVNLIVTGTIKAIRDFVANQPGR